MFRLSQSLEIDRAAAEVWPYLIAFEQVPLWEHGVVEVRQVTPGLSDIGTQISARRIYVGRETQLTGRIVDFEEGRSATMSLRGGPLDEVYVEYAVEPIEDRRSVVTYRARGNLIGPLRFLHPILPALGRAETRKNLAKLKRRIEAGIPPRSPEASPAPD
ncbi:MAG: SRPBCC family protein [Chloroflexota bacterium]|nr:SRPBCC family protein [Chloroflexota bacterium]